MTGKITNFFREVQFPLSIILVIIGVIIIYNGATGIWYQNYCILPSDYFDWSFYLLIVGFIILFAGIWYLYSFLNNRKFILEELETNKRSELLKRHNELKTTVKHMPKKYQKMLKDKENELKIK
jgi:hypothetical protein